MGKYTAHIRPALLYASECWAPSVNDLLKLERNDRAMFRWICNVRLKDRISSEPLLGNLISATCKHYYDITDCVGLVMLRGMMAVLTAKQH